MAKGKGKAKEGEEAVVRDDGAADLLGAIDAVEAAHAGVMRTGEQVLAQKPMVVSMGPAVDSVLGGGIPEGSWVTLSGGEGLGKTVTALTFAARCQRAEYGRRPVFYYAAEGRLKPRDLRGIKGLVTSDSLFHVVLSAPGHILTSQDYLGICTRFLAQVPGAVHVIDSVSSLVNPTVQEQGLGTQDRGAGYKIVSQFCDLNQAVVPINRSFVVGIVHLIANTGGQGAGKVPKVPTRWRYQTDVWLDGKWAEAWRVGADEDSLQIGQKVHWVTRKTALDVGPGGKCVSHLRYGTGVDDTYELLVFGKDLGLVQAKGSWLRFAFLDGRADLTAGTPFEGKADVQFQGGEKAYAALEANPAWAAALRGGLAAMLGGAA